MTSGMPSGSHLRVARPTDDLDAVVRFYRDGLGLEILARFEAHDGYDGVMLGRPGAPFHLEFTRRRGAAAGRAPTRDNLLVFYLGSKEARDVAAARMEAAGYRAVPSENPYWDRTGVTFEDPDGYRVVLEEEDAPAWTAPG